MKIVNEVVKERVITLSLTEKELSTLVSALATAPYESIANRNEAYRMPEMLDYDGARMLFEDLAQALKG